MNLRYTANLSILFTELPLLERPGAAHAAGFDAVEFWWPFDIAAPAGADVDRFVRAVGDAGVSLTGLNFFAGDMPAGERGLVSWPGREREFADSVAIAMDIGLRLGCRTFNALYGNRIDGIEPAAQDDLALSNMDHAAAAASAIGGQVVVEPLHGISSYPLRTAADAMAVVDKSGRDNVTLLADLFHLAANGDDLDAVITRYTPRIGHVQIADVPGRGEPGSGELDIDGYLTKLEAKGYRGYVGIEYKPAVPTTESLAWLPKERRAAK